MYTPSCTSDEVTFHIAHYVVYTKCGILHRDLSVNNIMFTRRGKAVVGILNDWDLAASVIPKDKATSKHRTGTAAFMALDLLANDGKPLLHEYHHDLESFVWILIWCAFVLRFKGEQVDWANQHPKIKEWTSITAWSTIGESKENFVRKCKTQKYLKFMTSEMKRLKKTWIVRVIRHTVDTIIARDRLGTSDEDSDEEGDEEEGDEEEEEEEEEESVSDGSEEATNHRAQTIQKNDASFFTFQRVMKVLEPSIKKPDVAVWNYGVPDC